MHKIHIRKNKRATHLRGKQLLKIQTQETVKRQCRNLLKMSIIVFLREDLRECLNLNILKYLLADSAASSL